MNKLLFLILFSINSFAYVELPPSGGTSTTYLASGDDVAIVSPSTYDVLAYSVALKKWTDTILDTNYLSDFDLLPLATNDVIFWNGSDFINTPKTSLLSLGDLNNVTETSSVTDDLVYYTGSQWANTPKDGFLSLDNLSDVVLSSATNNDFLYMSGGQWINTPFTFAHNDLTSLNVGNYKHLTAQEYTSLQASSSNFGFTYNKGTAPATSDDVAHGYRDGDIWVSTPTNLVYVLADSGNNNATWDNLLIYDTRNNSAIIPNNILLTGTSNIRADRTSNAGIAILGTGNNIVSINGNPAGTQYAEFKSTGITNYIKTTLRSDGTAANPNLRLGTLSKLVETGMYTLNSGKVGALTANGTHALSFAAGLVGIATTDPVSVLDINGDARVMANNPIKLADTDNSNYVGLKSPAIVTSDTTFILPGSDGTSGQFLKTNGSGVLSFDTPATGSSLSTLSDVNLSGGISTSSPFIYSSGKWTKGVATNSVGFYGAIRYVKKANCQWSTTATDYASFAADSDCNDATATGAVLAPSSKVPGLIIADMQPGRYFFTTTSYFESARAGAVDSTGFWRIFNGESGFSEQGLIVGGPSASVYIGIPSMSFMVDVPIATTDVSLFLQAKGVSTTTNYIDAIDTDFVITVVYYPSF